MADRIDRLRLVCAAAGLEPVGEPRQALSWSNDAWLVVARLRARPALRLDRVDAIVGADANLLPVGRALALSSPGVPGVDAGLLAEAVAAIEGLRHLDPRVDDASRHGVVHGDLHLHNLWVDGLGALTIMDFEWARLAPPVLELQRLCESADEDALAGRGPPRGRPLAGARGAAGLTRQSISTAS